MVVPDRVRGRFFSAALSVVLAALAGICAGCRRDEVAIGEGMASSLGKNALIDGLGRKVARDQPVRRVVSLAPSNTEIVFRLGAQDRLVARDARSDWPPEAESLASIGEVYPRPSLEGLVACDADLVLAAGLTSPEVVRSIEQLGLRVWTARYARTLDDIYADIHGIGVLLGAERRAADLIDEMRQKSARIAQRISGEAVRPRVFYELDATDPGRPWTAGPGTFVDTIIHLAGGENIARTDDGEYFQIGLEDIVARDPEVIVIGSPGDSAAQARNLENRPAWGAISAVRSGRVHVLDGDLLSRPGPRVVEGLERLAEAFHPERFR